MKRLRDHAVVGIYAERLYGSLDKKIIERLHANFARITVRSRIWRRILWRNTMMDHYVKMKR